MIDVSFKNKDKYLDAIDLIKFSKKTKFYHDILGVAEKIPGKIDLTIKLGLVKFFILNCPYVKKHIRAENPENLDYLKGFKEYTREIAFDYGNWFDAQKDIAKRLSDCAIYCSFLQ